MHLSPVKYVANQQQAEEVNLLLQSLGIDAYVFFDEQTGQWVIAVEATRHAEAQQVIAEDEREAISLPASPEPRLGTDSGLSWVVGLVLINVLVWWAMEQHGGSHSAATLIRFGAIRGSLLAAGEWWRAVTALFLHMGILHLFGNMAMLLVLGGLTLRMWGPGRLLFLYVLSGVLGNGASFLFGSPTALKAGASGAILGLLGALAGARLRQLHHPQPPSRFKRWHVLAMLVAFYGFVVGIRPHTDHIAHLGGLCGGVLLTLLLPPLPTSSERKLQWLVGLLAIVLCLIAGVCAVWAGS